MNGTGSHGETIPLNESNGKSTSDRPKGSRRATATICVSILAIIVATCFLVLPSNHSNQNDTPQEQFFDEDGRFVMEDYDSKPTFSDFLPGVAGIYGKPVWTFYVNRGQGIAAFGTKSKDYPLMEFNSANKAYQNTPLLGFRTFLQGSRRSRKFLAEPFSPLETRFFDGSDEGRRLPKRFMYVGVNEMQIQEIDFVNEIETNVTYFTLPEEDFGALVRRTTITNLDQQLPLTLSMLDGLARMEPAGGKLDNLLKTMGRTLEGWMGVYQPHNDSNTMPFYRLSTEPSDTASVKTEEAGHYCLSMIEGNPSTLLPIIYDTSRVFGEDTTLLRATELRKKTVRELLTEPQYGFAKTPSAFAAVESITIGPGESFTVSTFLGKADHLLDVPVIARRIIQIGFVPYKLSRAREIINQITVGVETRTGKQLFNAHIQQMYLDNALRGGIPVILGEVDDRAKMSNADEDERLKVYHLFSRIHGDLERDYNDFVIDPTYFSEGPGNYRDIAQNRRNDVIFNPRIGSFNIKLFLSFIQGDGYEPLSVESIVFLIEDKDTCDRIAADAVGHAEGHRAQRESLSQMLSAGPFRPGQLLEFMEKQNIFLLIPRQQFIDTVAAAASFSPMAVYKQGYWADHWTYYMELIETYLSVYPDGEEALMYDQQLKYFFSPGFVMPREKKYVLSVSFDGKGKHVRQLNATVDDKAKVEEQALYMDNTTNWYSIDASWKHDRSGRIFQSSPIAKLFLLATIKFATRDAYGMGIEYEGGRPGWNDAMNGLPGMIGSGMPETCELEVLLHYLLSVVSKYNRHFSVPAELEKLAEAINAALTTLHDYVDSPTLKAKVPMELFTYWDTVSAARELYRKEIETTFSGETQELSAQSVISMLRAWINEVELGKSRAIMIGTYGQDDNGISGIMPTYFAYNVTRWELTGLRNEMGHPLVIPKEMTVRRFPLFLEGPVRLMNSVDHKEALNIYSKVRSSGLRDQELGMYTVSASLKGQSFDMGRMMAFTPGWLENQSVWLHMSYKFMLQLLRHDLFPEFFQEMASGMLPFMKPDQYGRSLLECSSFIASSAFEDPAIRGRGFLARLSGSTAEFLSMWTLLMIGPRPFFLDTNGELRMQLVPALPLWFFQDESTNGAQPLTISFKLFGSINVTYHNLRQTDLLRVPPDRYKVELRDGTSHAVKGASIPSEFADKIRRVIFVDSIDAYFDNIDR